MVSPVSKSLVRPAITGSDASGVTAPISSETRTALLDVAQTRRAAGIVWGKPYMPPHEHGICLSKPALLGYLKMLHPASLGATPDPEGSFKISYPFRSWVGSAANAGQLFPDPLPSPTPLNCASFVLNALLEVRLLTAHEVHVFYCAVDKHYRAHPEKDPDYCAAEIKWLDGPGDWIEAHSVLTDEHRGDVVMAVDKVHKEGLNYARHVGLLGGLGVDPSHPEGGNQGMLLWDWDGDVRKEVNPEWVPLGGNSMFRRLPLADVVARVKAVGAAYSP